MAERKLILAVAGSGKTKYLIDRLNLKERFIIVTYTNTNLNLIKNRIVKRFGYYPDNIRTQKYFGFLYNFCIKPFVLFKYKVKGICFNRPKRLYSRKCIDEERRFYYNRLGKFAEDEGIIDDIKARLERFYDYLFFDEFQDLGDHDFNFITQIAKANIGFLFVGDFFQNTYVTSDDGNVNCNLYKDLEKYCRKLKEKNVLIDKKTLKNSYRCSPTICNFIRDKIGIEIYSNRKDITKIIPIKDKNSALTILRNNAVIKLVYDKKSNSEGFKSKNWGECKGEDDYDDTCIILNKKTAKFWKEEKLNELSPRTKNKLYVAISRTKGNCYLLDEKLTR